MSKKFFSLIHGESIHLAPEKKVLPEEAFSTVLDAKEILEKVKEDAEQYKREVAEQCEKLKEEAQREGFEKGYAEWIENIAELEDEIKKVRKDAERVMIPIALKAAKKIVGRELEINDSTVVDIISNCLKAVAAHKKIKIYVNKKEIDIMEKHKGKLKNVFENLEAFTIMAKEDVDPGGCIIETEAGIINAQLENQWMILENAFTKLLKSPKLKTEEEVKKAERKEQAEETKQA